MSDPDRFDLYTSSSRKKTIEKFYSLKRTKETSTSYSQSRHDLGLVKVKYLYLLNKI